MRLKNLVALHFVLPVALVSCTRIDRSTSDSIPSRSLPTPENLFENNKANIYNLSGPFVYRAAFTDIEVILSSSFDNSGDELPETLIISPGKYNFFGKTYDLREEGLYRFVNLGVENQQRVVYNTSIEMLLSGISWIVSHGNVDSSLDHDELTQKATRNKLSLLCGNTVQWTISSLKALNIDVREARALLVAIGIIIMMDTFYSKSISQN